MVELSLRMKYGGGFHNIKESYQLRVTSCQAERISKRCGWGLPVAGYQLPG